MMVAIGIVSPIASAVGALLPFGMGRWGTLAIFAVQGTLSVAFWAGAALVMRRLGWLSTNVSDSVGPRQATSG